MEKEMLRVTISDSGEKKVMQKPADVGTASKDSESRSALGPAPARSQDVRQQMTHQQDNEPEAATAKQPKRYSSLRQPKGTTAPAPGTAEEQKGSRPAASSSSATTQPRAGGSGRIHPGSSAQGYPPDFAAEALAAAFPAGHYPNGPPSGAPFNNQQQQQQQPVASTTSATRAVAPSQPSAPVAAAGAGGPVPTVPMPGTAAGPPPYINPNGQIYGPPPGLHPPQYTPAVTVPISVPMAAAAGLPGHHDPSSFAVPSAAAVPPHHGAAAAANAALLAAAAAGAGAMVPTPHQQQVLLAAAAAQHGAATAAAAAADGGVAEVRGGVTYFNPTAQPLAARPQAINKRPKAAIPIVDPSQVAGGPPLSSGDGKGGPSEMSPQSSLDSSAEDASDGGSGGRRRSDAAAASGGGDVGGKQQQMAAS